MSVERIYELFSDMVNAGIEIIDYLDFYSLCDKLSPLEMDRFENAVTICCDTGNIDACAELIASM